MAGAATALPRRAPRRRAAARASSPSRDKERLNWHYVPRRREGLPFKDMPAPARAAAHELMKASLSRGRLCQGRQRHPARGACCASSRRSAGSCAIPRTTRSPCSARRSTAAPWGWRLEGHHLSLNFTLVPGKPVAVTPAFLGANPAEVRVGPRKGLRTLAREQDLGPRAGAEHGRRASADARHRGAVARRHRDGPGRAREPRDARRACPRPTDAATSATLVAAARRGVRAQHARRARRRASSGGMREAGRRAHALRLGRARSSRRRPTTTASTGRRCSSSTTTRRTTPTTSTRCGTTPATISAPISSAPTTRLPPPPRLTTAGAPTAGRARRPYIPAAHCPLPAIREFRGARRRRGRADGGGGDPAAHSRWLAVGAALAPDVARRAARDSDWSRPNPLWGDGGLARATSGGSGRRQASHRGAAGFSPHARWPGPGAAERLQADARK